MTGHADDRPVIPRDVWKTLEPLLDAALELPADRRVAFIAGACGNDSALQARLEALVADADQADPVLDQPAWVGFPSLLDDLPSLPADLPQVLVGRFRIEREIGRGGMGIVLLARDLKHDREVAVKMMRPAAMSPVGTARFLAEIRLTAGLRHPHIVPLYDSGEVDDVVFFVMPYVDGESLRQRLDRAGALPPNEALGIAEMLTSALHYAHGLGIVHRDVKPSNVLISAGHALLADFGIARAMVVQPDVLTATGVAVGTPAYMSPEQATDPRAVDARSDIYSLGCVLHEMLTGDPPVNALTAIRLAAHEIDPNRAVREQCAAITPSIEACVSRAMALEPANRFQDAAELGRALATCADEPIDRAPAPAVRRLPARRGWVIGGIAALAVAVAGLALYRTPGANDRLPTTAPAPPPLRPADTTRYVVLPFTNNDSASARIDEAPMLRDALRRWDGVTVIDGLETDAAIAGYGSTPLTLNTARSIARQLSAGRYVWGDISTRAGAVIVHARIGDVEAARPLDEATVRVGYDTNLDSALAGLVDQLLLPNVAAEFRGSGAGTRSRPALQAYAGAQGAVRRWDLARADSLFDLATSYDHLYAEASLWLAQVRVWRDLGTASWQFAANRAAAGRDRLSASDRRVADVLVAYANGDTAGACGRWMKLAEEKSLDFGAWYGAALCQMRDHVVLPDGGSSSGWRFRASASQANRAFRRAFQILPATHREFSESWFAHLRSVLNAKPGMVRFGHAVQPDTGVFAAYPSWSPNGDSLAFIPYRLRDIMEGKSATLLSSRRDAVHRQRLLFREIATTWRAALPQSADAMLALALALDAVGDPTALDSVRIARRLAVDGRQRFRAAAAEVWLRTKLSVPSNIGELDSARALADSLVRFYAAPASDMNALASLAELVGRVHDAARFLWQSLPRPRHCSHLRPSAGQSIACVPSSGA
jgi:hypothetical protein